MLRPDTSFIGVFASFLVRLGSEIQADPDLQDNGGTVIVARETTRPDIASYLLIPNPEQEYPTYSGQAARIAHGLGHLGQVYGELRKASTDWIARCMKAGHTVEHDRLGLAGKLWLEKSSKHKSFNSTENATWSDRNRINTYLLQMDEFFARSPRATQAQFYTTQDERDRKDGRGYPTAARSFCTKYKPVFNDCCPYFHNLTRQKPVQGVVVEAVDGLLSMGQASSMEAPPTPAPSATTEPDDVPSPCCEPPPESRSRYPSPVTHMGSQVERCGRIQDSRDSTSEENAVGVSRMNVAPYMESADNINAPDFATEHHAMSGESLNSPTLGISASSERPSNGPSDKAGVSPTTTISDDSAFDYGTASHGPTTGEERDPPTSPVTEALVAKAIDGESSAVATTDGNVGLCRCVVLAC